jgi:hypothetical protein
MNPGVCGEVVEEARYEISGGCSSASGLRACSHVPRIAASHIKHLTAGTLDQARLPLGMEQFMCQALWARTERKDAACVIRIKGLKVFEDTYYRSLKPLLVRGLHSKLQTFAHKRASRGASALTEGQQILLSYRGPANPAGSRGPWQSWDRASRRAVGTQLPAPNRSSSGKPERGGS